MNKISSEARFLGRSLERSDGRAKAEGKAEYLRDMLMPEMAFAAVIRSPYPRAKLKKINKHDALQISGVIDVITPQEVKSFAKAWEKVTGVKIKDIDSMGIEEFAKAIAKMNWEVSSE